MQADQQRSYSATVRRSEHDLCMQMEQSSRDGRGREGRAAQHCRIWLTLAVQRERGVARSSPWLALFGPVGVCQPWGRRKNGERARLRRPFRRRRRRLPRQLPRRKRRPPNIQLSSPADARAYGYPPDVARLHTTVWLANPNPPRSLFCLSASTVSIADVQPCYCSLCGVAELVALHPTDRPQLSFRRELVHVDTRAFLLHGSDLRERAYSAKLALELRHACCGCMRCAAIEASSLARLGARGAANAA